MTRRAVVVGTGHYLPKRVVENAEFEKTLDTSDEWIRARSGIERRHFAEEGETTSAAGCVSTESVVPPPSCSPDFVSASRVLDIVCSSLTFAFS